MLLNTIRILTRTNILKKNNKCYYNNAIGINNFINGRITFQNNNNKIERNNYSTRVINTSINNAGFKIDGNVLKKYNRRIRKTKEFFHVEQLYNEMKKKDIVPNQGTLHCVLDQIKRKNPSKAPIVAEQYYREMLSYNVRPNVGTFMLLLGVAGDLENAVSYFEEMYQLNIQPNLYCYNRLFTYFIPLRDLKGFTHYYKQMLKLDIEPDNLTHLSHIQLHLLNDNIDEALNILKSIEKTNESSTSMIYHRIIYYYMIGKDYIEAEELYNEMISFNITPSAKTIKYLIDFLPTIRTDFYKEEYRKFYIYK
eukprot:TRINITY_DN13193_c0_g1_i1.p1 TRINITY_DN13193_c0_g1~~TRINITY_DN13193_c0_g1_i1.p1  ORF type:complete len:309 (+),score=62.40 TRINITY_DN13193_c0_g1_i1:40-966(+)